MKRINFLRITSGSIALVLVGGAGAFLQGCKKMAMDVMSSINVLTGNFDNPLRMFEVLTNSLPIQLIAKQNKTSLIKGKTTFALGYTNDILGPIIKVNQNETVQITLQNQLQEATNIHWHGLIIPEAMDGHPRNLVQPGSSFTYQFLINQRAGTNWFHPHPHGTTGKQVFKGLAGILIINDLEEQALNLPSGEFEIPLIIQDKRIYSDGALNYSPESMDYMSGYFGQYVCVNGTWSAFHEVKTKIYRLRIVNGSNARIYNLSLSNGSPIHIIGSDGGLLSSLQSVNSVLFSPGERLDVLVDFSQLQNGEEVYLQSTSFNGGESQGNSSFNILKFKVKEVVIENFSLPSTLSSIVSINPSLAINTRTFDIANVHMGEGGGHGGHGGGNLTSLHKIGGKSFEMDRIDEQVVAGTTEIWEFDNSMGADAHPIHLHGLHFQVVSRLGGRGNILPHESGWKDTVLCLPGEKVRIIMTFPNNLGTFVFHCHNLEHEDTGMMLNYKII